VRAGTLGLFNTNWCSFFSSYLLVYIGAVSILFLFVLMLINVRLSELQSNTRNSLPLGYLVGVAILYSLSRATPIKNTGDILSMFKSDVSTSYPAIDLDVDYLTSINS